MTKSKIRLNKNAEDIDDIADYFQVRSQQLRPYRFGWTGVIEKHDCGYTTTFQALATNGHTYNSFYLPKSMRGKGLAQKLLAKCERPIVTMPDCDVIGFIKSQGREPLVITGPYALKEYELITQHYGDQRAVRTGQFYMQHIDEGLCVLSDIGVSPDASQAYCLHPMLQDDESLSRNLARLARERPAWVIALAMEYRNLANAYLPKHFGKTATRDINVGRIHAVRHMLIADKIQNYKDFLLHTPNVGRVDQYLGYFTSWFRALELSPKVVDALVKNLNDGDCVGNGKVQIVDKTGQTS